MERKNGVDGGVEENQQGPGNWKHRSDQREKSFFFSTGPTFGLGWHNGYALVFWVTLQL